MPEVARGKRDAQVHSHRPRLDRRWSRRQILESNTATVSESFSSFCYPPQELGIVLQPIVEPVVLAFKADQHACGFPVSCDEEFLG